MRLTNPALAIVMGGALCGALAAQGVPTDIKGVSAKPGTPTAPESCPEIVGITYETLPGAASDPYNFTPRASGLRHARLPEASFDDPLGYSKPEYLEDPEFSQPDPQIIEDQELIAVDAPDDGAFMVEDVPKLASAQPVG